MKILVSLLMIPVTLLVCGVALQDLWGWFIVPLGVGSLLFWQALGLSLVVGTMTMRFTPQDLEADEDVSWKVNTFGPTLRWLLAWGIGALFSLGMP